MKRGEINPVIGVTDGNMRSQVRSALRKVWRNSARRVFVESIRRKYVGPGRFKYGVDCAECRKHMGQTEKAFMLRKDGTPTKRKKLVYEIDHLSANPPFLDIEEDLGAYAQSLIYGRLRVLCLSCHSAVTAEQRKK